MTKIKAQAKNIRIGPRKLARVLDSIRGMSAQKAMEVLTFMPQKGADILLKVIKSAVANAKNNYKLPEAGLFIAEAFVTKAVTMKRWRARARGRVGPILKRNSHLTVWIAAPEVTAKEES
ncbi:50S ribosomal protein L22 [candidate division WOR-1 bacterium RIFOXYB2_FULL_42_35]|uniref:Large ribosomal subunit protein uL22 n=1 Tax=candidate division WOR-1 bacterium RIFOXYC2_FULL_41_25 TaxID=1802586 RepID=A0A1F4TM12_UNCSA|nr:MAG: 50S ribosomal protein L22 [candidate division WOR-1 bacterium RIFOXYA2_FULL_41_14]OGC23859.1 MAG: 50S ribosomal protein L22 [candidate division WOR-1 bacterium RIFOXYB2_FULL_42_35]OGC33734.1 MAG: 50S ribosomal protein L22 [candidate division WOR-1 bacterium RIFOXYC2_FULL_41_25]